MIKAFEDYIRDSNLPTAGRLMLAAMICALAPQYNPQFERDRFLVGCGLDGELTDNALIEAHIDVVRRLSVNRSE